MIVYIYKIDIPATGQCYIGQTTRPIEVRFREHTNPKKISLIARAIQHWGDPKIVVLHKVNSKEELNGLRQKRLKLGSPSSHLAITFRQVQQRSMLNIETTQNGNTLLMTVTLICQQPSRSLGEDSLL